MFLVVESVFGIRKWGVSRGSDNFCKLFCVGVMRGASGADMAKDAYCGYDVAGMKLCGVV